jgi:hypothetical protein
LTQVFQKIPLLLMNMEEDVERSSKFFR